MKTENKDRTIITVVGCDAVGIIAKICTYLSNNNINVMDISQTIVDGLFNMMMIVDLSRSDMPFAQCQKELGQIGEEIGVEIRAQKEEIFRMMHRV